MNSVQQRTRAVLWLTLALGLALAIGLFIGGQRADEALWVAELTASLGPAVDDPTGGGGTAYRFGAIVSLVVAGVAGAGLFVTGVSE